MAQFEVVEQEGMRFVKITIENETVQAERGALCWMTGDIAMEARIPFIGTAVRAYLSEEAFIRPAFTGSGTIYLESSLGGFHVFDVAGDPWILESGAYWASEGSVGLSVRREKMWTSFWAGEGFIDWQTHLTGGGRVVLNTQGPIDDMMLDKGQELVVNGKYVLARTADVSYRIRRAATTLVGTHLSGEGYCRCYAGPGRVLLCATPYWRYRILKQHLQTAPQSVAAVA